MSDVSGMFGRKEGGSLVVIVKLSGTLEAAPFEELLASLEDLKRRFGTLKVDIQRLPQAAARTPPRR
jgi:hypothetical protein